MDKQVKQNGKHITLSNTDHILKQLRGFLWFLSLDLYVQTNTKHWLRLVLVDFDQMHNSPVKKTLDLRDYLKPTQSSFHTKFSNRLLEEKSSTVCLRKVEGLEPF